MTPAQLNRSLQSVGMKCFVSYFEEFSDPFLSNGAVSEILVEREFYTEKAGRSRTSTARAKMASFQARFPMSPAPVLAGMPAPAGV